MGNKHPSHFYAIGIIPKPEVPQDDWGHTEEPRYLLYRELTRFKPLRVFHSHRERLVLRVSLEYGNPAGITFPGILLVPGISNLFELLRPYVAFKIQYPR